MNLETETPTLSDGEERALAALLSEPTVDAAAKKAGLSARTMRRYMNRPDFAAALREARRETMRGISKRLQKAAVQAVKTLRAAMKDASAPGPRVTAARCVLDLVYRATELEELDERIATLESRVSPPETN